MEKSEMNQETTIAKNHIQIGNNSKNKVNREQFFLGQPWLVKERDACGVGFIADRDGHCSHKLIQQALKALGCMEHRGGV